jgi:hypothetical protein
MNFKDPIEIPNEYHCRWAAERRYYRVLHARRVARVSWQLSLRCCRGWHAESCRQTHAKGVRARILQHMFRRGLAMAWAQWVETGAEQVTHSAPCCEP